MNCFTGKGSIENLTKIKVKRSDDRWIIEYYNLRWSIAVFFHVHAVNIDTEYDTVLILLVIVIVTYSQYATVILLLKTISIFVKSEGDILIWLNVTAHYRWTSNSIILIMSDHSIKNTCCENDRQPYTCTFNTILHLMQILLI